jgi:hypothetical protein
MTTVRSDDKELKYADRQHSTSFDMEAQYLASHVTGLRVAQLRIGELRDPDDACGRPKRLALVLTLT